MFYRRPCCRRAVLFRDNTASLPVASSASRVLKRVRASATYYTCGRRRSTVVAHVRAHVTASWSVSLIPGLLLSSNQ